MPTLADYLSGKFDTEEVISETVEKVAETEKSKYLENSVIDKLASTLESFTEKEAGIWDVFKGESVNTPVKTEDLPSRTEIIDTNPSLNDVKKMKKDVDYATRTTQEANQLSKDIKRLKALREGTLLTKYPWILPALLGGAGGLYLGSLSQPAQPQGGMV